jgi:hypothetical protein
MSQRLLQALSAIEQNRFFINWPVGGRSKGAIVFNEDLETLKEVLSEAINRERDATPDMFDEGVNYALYELCKELDVSSKDIRTDNKDSVDGKCARLAKRIVQSFKSDTPPQESQSNSAASLTLDELSKRHEKPVWIELIAMGDGYWDIYLKDVDDQTEYANFVRIVLKKQYYGKTWVAYDLPPSGGIL